MQDKAAQGANLGTTGGVVSWNNRRHTLFGQRWPLVGTVCSLLLGSGAVTAGISFAQTSDPVIAAQQEAKTGKEVTVLPVMTVKDMGGSGTRTIPTDVLQRTQALD
uniref:hypothetical protein n=1 Tax=Desulfobulbus elongatus TaxID=53332 RepID=UPI00054EB9FA